MSHRRQPVASRPHIEGYGIPEPIEGVLPWSHARQRLETARHFWIITCSPNGQPHAVPVWGVWLEEALYFSTSPATRTARNLTAHAAAAVHLECGDDVVILEGTARFVEPIAQPIATAIDDAMAAKYDYRPSTSGDSPEHGMFVFTPRVAFAWTSFPADATRWMFPDE